MTAIPFLIMDQVYNVTFIPKRRNSIHVNASDERFIFLLIEERGRTKTTGVIFLSVLSPLLSLATPCVPSVRRGVPVAVWGLVDWWGVVITDSDK